MTDLLSIEAGEGARYVCELCEREWAEGADPRAGKRPTRCPECDPERAKMRRQQRAYRASRVNETRRLEAEVKALNGRLMQAELRAERAERRLEAANLGLTLVGEQALPVRSSHPEGFGALAVTRAVRDVARAEGVAGKASALRRLSREATGWADHLAAPDVDPLREYLH